MWRRWFVKDKDGDVGRVEAAPAGSALESFGRDHGARPDLVRRISRKVVAGLPRAQTFKRQQSELRNNLEATEPTPAERRTVSMDRRLHHESIATQADSNPRASAPDFLSHSLDGDTAPASLIKSLPSSPLQDKMRYGIGGVAASVGDANSITTSEYDAMIRVELEATWILNLSMHFRDKSKREKFFVTYRPPECPSLWRRVTISLDYRDAPENSLEMDLVRTKFQRDKMAKIYEAIRESLNDIQFYDTVTNLKLQTQIKEKDIEFEAHMSGFVYKVNIRGQVLIKKEIPGPDTVDEFLYEINALNRLSRSRNVIEFYGVVVDDREEHVKGLLISFADKGALIDVIYDHDHTLSWVRREKWARQIVAGLSEIHEAGFVQGDFTLSNIVIDEGDNAKIIDINRRGCPVGWEPPEATPLIESGQRISMYIGVKSDLYQLGMVLWSLAMQEDEPEQRRRPLQIDADIAVPAWYRYIVEMCLSEDPSERKQASSLLSVFPKAVEPSQAHASGPLFSDGGYRQQQGYPEPGLYESQPIVKTVQPSADWPCVGWDRNSMTDDLCYYPPRGRSPPSPQPSSHDDFARYGRCMPSWSDHYQEAVTALSVGDAPPAGAEADRYRHENEEAPGGVQRKREAEPKFVDGDIEDKGNALPSHEATHKEIPPDAAAVSQAKAPDLTVKAPPPPGAPHTPVFEHVPDYLAGVGTAYDVAANSSSSSSSSRRQDVILDDDEDDDFDVLAGAEDVENVALKTHTILAQTASIDAGALDDHHDGSGWSFGDAAGMLGCGLRFPGHPDPQLFRCGQITKAFHAGRHYRLHCPKEDQNWYKHVNWLSTTLIIFLPLAGFISAYWVTLQRNTALFAIAYYFFSGLGITAGYHRLWAHRSYKATLPLRIFLAAGGAAAVEGSARWWSRDHRSHHRYTDTDKDPYSVRKGLLYSHLGWMVMKQNPKRIGRTDITDLNADPVIVWQHKNYLKCVIFCALVIPTVACGVFFNDWLGGFVYAGILRVCFVQQATFCVNSLAHWLGDQPFDDRDSPRDHLVTALVTLGEGYHNFHHEFPVDYRNGIEWYQYDPTKHFIWLCSLVGLAYDLKTFRRNAIELGRWQQQKKKLDARKLEVDWDNQTDRAWYLAEAEKLDQRRSKLDWGTPIADLQEITWDDYVSRCNNGECLIAIEGVVHDVKSFIAYHPGGRALINSGIGKDATGMFTGGVYEHNNAAHNLLRLMRVGRLVGGSEVEIWKRSQPERIVPAGTQATRNSPPPASAVAA
ncbi:hypothetical protein P8C59_001316 [Phyllachora maydis]|uniref:Uncharacterized protein n=1 Tax=Phyllachora maydis TaxID=1825666 RepID=A0AAD9MA32_9PEZI|nr:hypothetical protein P8C59_001316 [Phyllachora maydis]